MPFNVPEEKKPEFNKQVKKGLELLTGQINETALQAAASEPLPIDYSSLISDIEQGVIQEGALEPPRVEIDAIRDADGNIISNPLDLLSTPLNENKSKALGLIDAEGNATDKGELFFNMKEAGMFDDAGVITDKGKAYLLPKDELLKEENRPAFRMLWDDGVIREEAKTEDMVDAVLEAGGEALSGVGSILSLTAQNLYYQFDNRKGWAVPFFRGADTDNRPQELIDKTIAGNLSIVDKFTANTLDLARMVDVASAWTIAEMKDPANWGESAPAPKDNTDELYAARQRQMATRETIKNMAAGEAAEVIVGLPEAVAVAEEARRSIGPEEFDKVYGKISSTMEFVGGLENIVPAAFAFNIAKSGPVATRAIITAQKNITKVLAQELEIAARQTSIEAAKLTIEKGNRTASLANKIAQKGTEAGADAATIARAERAAEIAANTTKVVDEAAATLPVLTSELDELTRIRNSTATRIPEIASKAAIKTLEAGRALRGMPASAIGSVLEGFGSTLTKVDNTITNFLKERGIDQMYTAGVGAAGVAGVAGSPVIGSIAAGAAALKAGKAITNYGKLFKYVGKEMTQARGQIPFWKRVAAHTEPSSLNRGIAHAFNMLDLGGVTSDTLRRIPKGIAAAYPVDLMFEYLSDGGDMRPQTFYQAAAESLVIGGSFAAAGGAFMGTKSRMRELSNGDRVNFMQNISDPRQKVLYGELSPGNQKAIATYSIANPTLNYVFKESGGSNYDPNTNTATINVRSNNSIKPLIAHETLHHTVIKNNMEAGISALFLGDTINNTVGGLLRSKDGKLDPNFEAFKDSYYQRLRSAGMTNAEINATYPLDKVAVEYFIEQHADQYAEMAESGELGATAASGDIKRKLSGVLETVLPRIPVLKELHFKSGGMIDKDGGWVTGNGILDADGVKTNPIAKKMFKDMNRRSAGLTPGQFEPLVSDRQDGGAQIILDPSSPIDSELLHPLIKVDENGVPVLENGKPVALDKSTLLERSLAGLTAQEVMRRKKADNYIPEKGEAHIDDLGEFQPGWLSNDVLSEMFAKNRLNPEQKRIIREMNRMIRDGKGGRAVMINFPATTRNKAGKVIYKTQGATLRDTVPVAITISKDGNLLFGLMSVNKLQENIQKRSQSRRGKKLYGGNVDLILRDTQAMMQFHKDGIDSIEYFKDKYGAVEATERKNFINTMFGLLNQKEQAVLNPMLIEDGVKSRDNVYRTYRADRVSKAVAMSPEDYPAMPFSYEATSQVKMPEQTRQMPEEPITSSSEKWKSMSNEEKDAYVFTPAEMTPSNRAEFDARVESGSLPADTPVVNINRSNLLTSRYGPPSSSATGNINTWIDDNTGKPVAIAFSENGNIPTKGERSQTPRYMPEKVDAEYMKAVKAKDVEAQQRITDETAKKNGATVGIVHHGTKQRFNEFESKRDPTGLIYFSFDEKFAKNYPRGSGGHRNPTPEIRQRIDAVKAESKKLFDPLAEELDKTYPTIGNTTEEGLKAWSKYFDDQKAWEKSKLDGMTVSEAEMGMGIQVIPAYLFTKKVFDPATNWKEFKSEILEALNEKSINDLNPQTIKMIEDGNYLIWENKNIIDSVFKKYDALILNESGSKNIAVRDPSLIKRADPITRDDSGNIIPPSKRFNTESKDIRYMPEKVDAEYMKAVETGDVEAQQKAVDEAAKAAGYKFQAKHGTPEKKLFTEFGERGKLTGAKSAEKAFFFSDSEALTDTYRMQNRKEPDEAAINNWVDGLSDIQVSKLLPRDYRLPMDTPFMIEYARDTIKEQGLDFTNEMGEDIYYGLDELVSKAKSNKIPFPKEFDPKDIGNTYSVKLRIDDPYYFTYDQYEVSGMDGIVKQAIEKGHDGIISKDKISDAFSGWDNKTPPSGIIYAVFDPEQIKSADPITRDDSGNIIPPSKRFNTESKDIRYMPEKDADVKIIEKSDTDTEQGTPAPDSDVQSIPLTGNPIPWDRTVSQQVRFMPEAIRDAFPTMSPELLAEIEKETSTLAAIHIDRMRVGEYMGIDLQGGMFYPTIKENLENGIVWAFNSTGVARTVANRAAQNNGYVKLVLMQEGNVVGNKTFANIWFKILSDSIDKKQISKGLALTELNAARRTVYKTLENKDIKKNPWVVKHAKKWNSIEEAKQAILSMPQIERGGTYFKKSKTETKAEGEKIAYQALLSQKMAKLGFPDARKIVNDIEEPAFKGIPTGAAVAIIKFDPLGANDKIMTASEAGVPEHMSYGYVLKGKPIAKLAYYQVVEETFPTTKGQIMTQQHTDFPVSKSIPSKEGARGEIKYNQNTQSAIANAAKLK